MSLLVSLLLVCCGDTPATDTARGEPTSADVGWRWESYAGIEVQVPEAWVGRTSGVAGFDHWCLSDEERPAPGVNRPVLFPVVAVGCAAKPVERYSAGLELGVLRDVGQQELPGPWVVETVEVAGVRASVTSDDPEERRRVVDSVRPVRGGVDVHGCELDSPLRRRGARPPAGELPGGDEVVAVSACRYLTYAIGREPLQASVRWTGSGAAELADALAEAPPGGGPDDTGCAARDRAAQELLVLRLDDGTTVHDVVVWYAGCVGNGVDDGSEVRRLTEDLVQRLLIGSLRPDSLVTAQVAELAGRRDALWHR